MIDTASQLLHAHCGSPAAEGCAPLPPSNACRVCGGHATRGVDVDQWSPTWLFQAKIRAPLSPYACEACVYLCARFSPVPGKPPAPGKKDGPRFSNLSHLYEETPAGVVYRAASKGEKPVILEFLRREKRGRWFAAIADSGQKHVLPWTPVNPAGARVGRVLFEETPVVLPASLELVTDMAALLTAGATKEELGRGDYGAFAWMRCPAAIRGFEERHGAARHSSWFTLALWLAQRDEEQVQARLTEEKAARAAARRERGTDGSGQGPARRRDGRGDRPGAERVPGDAGGERAPALGPDPGPGPDVGSDQHHAGGVGDVAVPQPQAAGARQLSLGVDLDTHDDGGRGRRRPRVARSRRA